MGKPLDYFLMCATDLERHNFSKCACWEDNKDECLVVERSVDTGSDHPYSVQMKELSSGELQEHTSRGPWNSSTPTCAYSLCSVSPTSATSLSFSPRPMALDHICIKRVATALPREYQFRDLKGVTRLGNVLKVPFEWIQTVGSVSNMGGWDPVYRDHEDFP